MSIEPLLIKVIGFKTVIVFGFLQYFIMSWLTEGSFRGALRSPAKDLRAIWWGIKQICRWLGGGILYCIFVCLLVIMCGGLWVMQLGETEYRPKWRR